MTNGPAVDPPGEHLLEDHEDAAVLCVVVDQRPVELSSPIVFPASLAFKNLNCEWQDYSSECSIVRLPV